MFCDFDAMSLSWEYSFIATCAAYFLGNMHKRVAASWYHTHMHLFEHSQKQTDRFTIAVSLAAIRQFHSHQPAWEEIFFLSHFLTLYFEKLAKHTKDHGVKCLVICRIFNNLFNKEIRSYQKKRKRILCLWGYKIWLSIDVWGDQW